MLNLAEFLAWADSWTTRPGDVCILLWQYSDVVGGSVDARLEPAVWSPDEVVVAPVFSVTLDSGIVDEDESVCCDRVSLRA